MTYFAGCPLKLIGCVTQEYKMLLKERASGMYRLSAFYFARTASDLPMDFAVPTIFIVIIYFMAHLRYTAQAFFSNFFTVILMGLVSPASTLILTRRQSHINSVVFPFPPFDSNLMFLLSTSLIVSVINVANIGKVE